MNSSAPALFSTVNSTIPNAGTQLSIRLRDETRLEHKLVEAACNLPSAIQNMRDYENCLLNFYSIFCPLERHISTFNNWEQMGLMVQERARTPSLQQDLRLMNVNPDLWCAASAHALPALPKFSFALGALYVLEGSTLGGQIIMSALMQQLRTSFDVPNSFFAGRGKTTGPLWHQFCVILDAYGQQFPEVQAEVVEGAKRTFNAISAWFNQYNNRVK